MEIRQGEVVRVGTVVIVKVTGLGEDKAEKHSKAFESSLSLDSGWVTKLLHCSELQSVLITLKNSLDHTRVCMN